MSKRESDSWPEELTLIPIIFTLSGIYFTLMVVSPSLPPPYYIILNSLYGSLGVILIASVSGNFVAFESSSKPKHSMKNQIIKVSTEPLSSPFFSFSSYFSQST